ncbi:MAG: glycosyltransferase family 2 protein [Pseudomonadota bacterium]
MTEPVTIVIPTFKRAAQLEAVVESVFGQTGLSAIRPRMIIVDNDPAGSALPMAENLRRSAPEGISIDIIHCREPGVANARNAAMEQVETRLVAFIDDDQTAPPDWLSNLLAAYSAHGAAVTFGPVDAVLPEAITRHRAYFESFFSRRPDHETGVIAEFYGCGNALMDLEQLPKLNPLFDTRMNEVGGEDDLLFIRAEEKGCNFAWAGDARVWEHVPEKRATLEYTLPRAISYGQGPTRKAEETRDFLQLVYWMGVGAGQFAVFGLMAAIGWVTGSNKRAVWLDRAAQGLGKVVWRKQFKFYGQSQIPKATPSDETTRLTAKSSA